ncbi:hypothetical protein SAMN02910317_02632 [Ruminococcaceae bacterium FB2012]|nr:hypothetical protein SAMN02910317_02632 [Ruminococcaceae bacterium FB2012]
MPGLLKNAFRVHFRSLIFFLCCGGVLMTSIISGVNHRGDIPGVIIYNDYFKVYPFAAALIAVCVSAAFGICPEFAYGTVKNKLIHGCSKLGFCISHLAAVLTECLIFCLLAWAPYRIIAHEKYFSLYSSEVLVRAFGLIFASMLMISLLTFAVCITVRKTAFVMIVCAFLFLGLSWSADRLENELHLPVYTLENGEDDMIYRPETDSWEYVVIREPDKVPYPWYVDGVKRKVYYAAYVLNPMTCLKCGQDYLHKSDDCFTLEGREYFIENHEYYNDTYIYNKEFERDYKLNNIYYPLWSGSLTLLLTVIGVLISRKRNIN